jgi:hypothetical protein
LEAGFRTQDIFQEGKKLVGTEEMGKQTIQELDKLLN